MVDEEGAGSIVCVHSFANTINIDVMLLLGRAIAIYIYVV